jgi:hypothetical protein
MPEWGQSQSKKLSNQRQSSTIFRSLQKQKLTNEFAFRAMIIIVKLD